MRFLRLPRGLRAQLLVPLLGALVLAEIISLVLFFDERRQAVRAALGGEIAGRIANVVRLIEATPGQLDTDILRSAESPFVGFALGTEPAVSAADGRAGARIAAIIRTGLGDTDRPVRVAVERVSGHMGARFPPGRDAGWMREVHRLHHPDEGDPMELVVAVALNDGRWLNVDYRFHRPPFQAAWPSVLAMLLAAVAIVVVVIWSVQRISRPMRVLAESADRLGRGDEPEPLAPEGPAEVRRVMQAFNMMQERLTRHVRERTRMLAALGHDLRSPLTAMRLRAEMVDDDETRERLSATIDEMQTMVETTLSYAKSVAVDEPTVPADLREMVEDIAEELRLGGSRVEIAPGDALIAAVRPIALKRAVRNLIENAAKFGERAVVRVERADAAARIFVDDDGPGIPEADLAHVFEPFVRLDASRNRETGGVGLGLSVARTIARAHGGDVSLRNRPEGGLCATISLPVRAGGAGLQLPSNP